MYLNFEVFWSYDDFVKTYPINGCDSFEKSLEIHFINGVEIFNDGLNAYSLFKDKCENGETITLQDKEKVDIAEVKCMDKVQDLKPYLKLEVQL